MAEVIIRPGRKEDLGDVLFLIKELAKYERAEDQVKMTESELLKCGFGPNPLFNFIVAEFEGSCIGMALYYNKFSTWQGAGLFLEDLVVSEKHRNKGVGKRLMDNLILKANEMGSARLEWQVLDWNKPAIEFYKRYDVEFDGEWLNVRVNLSNNEN